MAGINGEYLKRFAADLTAAERDSDLAKSGWTAMTFVVYNDLSGLYLLEAIPDKGERFSLASGTKLEIMKAMTALQNFIKVFN